MGSIIEAFGSIYLLSLSLCNSRFVLGFEIVKLLTSRLILSCCLAFSTHVCLLMRIYPTVLSRLDPAQLGSWQRTRRIRDFVFRMPFFGLLSLEQTN